MTENGILRHTPCRAAFKGGDVVYPFASVDAFAKQILIDIGYGARVKIYHLIPSIDLGEERLVCQGRFDFEAGLQHGIAGDHCATGSKLRTVQRMSERCHELASALAGHNRVTVEGDNVPDPAEAICVTFLHREVDFLAIAEQQSVQVR